MRLRFGDAVVVLDLVGHLQRAAGQTLRIPGERDGRSAVRNGGELPLGLAGGRADMGCAIACDGEMSFVGAFGCLLGRLGFGHAAPCEHIERAAAGADDQRGACRNRQGSRGRDGGFLVGGRQDDRRLAGIERRRHPGVDPDIGRRQHPVPVERRLGAQHALVAGGDIGRHHHHHDQRAQRPGIVDRQPRRRQAGADTLDGRQSALALRLPQRLGDRIPGRKRIGQRGRGAVADARAAVEPAQALFAARPAEPDKRKQGAHRRQHEQAEAYGTRHKRQRQPQSGPGGHQKQSDDGQEPGQVGPNPLPGDRISGPLQCLRELEPRNGIRGRGLL